MTTSDINGSSWSNNGNTSLLNRHFSPYRLATPRIRGRNGPHGLRHAGPARKVPSWWQRREREAPRVRPSLKATLAPRAFRRRGNQKKGELPARKVPRPERRGARPPASSKWLV